MHACSCPANASLLAADTLDSHRLGNLASAWWFGRQRRVHDWFVDVEAKAAKVTGGGESAHFKLLRSRQLCGGGACFGAHLARQSGVSTLPSACIALLEERWVQEDLMAHFFVTSHMIYATPILTACSGGVLRSFGRDLRRALQTYLLLSPAAALLPPRPTFEPSHCIVHFRVGDYLSLQGAPRAMIDPRSVAAATASLRPTIVEIMDGGVEWLSASSADPSAASVAARSRAALDRLRHALHEALPRARIVGPTRRSSDEDFVRLVEAPLLVLAGGSFALAAAIAASAAGPRERRQRVRSPACDHHLDVFATRRAAGKYDAALPEGWREYEYEVVPV